MPAELGTIPWPTRVMVYRDALMLALADAGSLSPEEQDYLRSLAERLGLPEDRCADILAWVTDYSDVLDRFEDLLREA